jgi:ElaB/YqjD/DUF883 family membrane-anchored ribosome-binding protein
MTATTRRTAHETNGVIGRVAKNVAGLRESASRAVSDTAHRASGLAADFADEAATRSRVAAKAAVQEIRKHPATALAIGAAVGIVIAAVILGSRRRSS